MLAQRRPSIDIRTKLIDKMNDCVNQNEKFFSLEFFPPLTPNGTTNLYEKCDRFSKGQPLFCDMTYTTSRLISKGTTDHYVDMAVAAQDFTQCDTMLQLNASLLSEDTALELLWKAKNRGLSTLMVVSGYPNIALSKEDSEKSFQQLLSEVDAGADFIITQMVFEANDFINFAKRCRKCGIQIPIIPGIFPIQSYDCIRKLNRYSKVKVPDKIMNILEPIHQNDQAVMKYGIYLTVELCRLLLQSIFCVGIHFFTLNREIATTQILKQVGLWKEATICKRVLPWLHNESSARHGEDVRPIFWSCRPESYEYRTAKWEEFPNGRWGDSSSASFGTFKDYHLIFAKNATILTEYRKMWGYEIRCLEDIYNVFIAFLSKSKNRQGFQVTNIPWTEEELSPETKLLSEDLIYINSNGFLTINSQPSVNCVGSCDKTFGWGSPGGYVFQKAYLEFFCNDKDGKNLLSILPNYPSVNYHLINCSETENHSNTETANPNAVTWGVFTGSLVKQPTVVDPISFQFWKDEAFELWLQQWGSLYEKNTRSWEIIKDIHDTFYLVNLVDNDYVKGSCLFDIVKCVIHMRN